MAMNKWVPETNPMVLRRVGKTGEEAAELLKVTNRIVIQGIDGVDPASGKTNLRALTEEIADVMAQCDCCIDALSLDWDFIRRRVREKVELMREWEALFDQPRCGCRLGTCESKPSGCRMAAELKTGAQ